MALDESVTRPTTGPAGRHCPVVVARRCYADQTADQGAGQLTMHAAGPPNSSSAPDGGRVVAEVVIPLKWSGVGETHRVDEMGRYLAALRRTVAAVTVVDGSAPPVRRAHEAAWRDHARVIGPDESQVEPSCGETHEAREARNGKVTGAMTGIRAARHEYVVLADDDVRHTPRSLHALVDALRDVDLVRPVNVYDTWPWQARWDGARTLLNVAVATDWPGTFALRRSTVVDAGGWCPHVLFENLELWRTVEASGGRTRALPHVLVARHPPSAGQFWSQRVRQAYDDLAQPGRLLIELAIVPTTAALAVKAPRTLGPLAAGVVLLASGGRRRLGGKRVPAGVPCWAPLWVIERGVCIWLAVGSRMRGGVRYHGQRLRVAAHSPARLRRAARSRAAVGL